MFPPDLIVKYKDIFDKYDNGNKGFLDKNELRTCLDSEGYNFNAEVFGAIFIAIDKDENFKITFDEFLELNDFIVRIHQLFNRYRDPEREFLDEEGLKNILNDIGFSFSDAQFQIIWSTSDIDNNSEIDFEELSHLAMKLRNMRLLFQGLSGGSNVLSSDRIFEICQMMGLVTDKQTFRKLVYNYGLDGMEFEVLDFILFFFSVKYGKN